MYVSKSEHGFLPLHSSGKFVNTKCKRFTAGWSQQRLIIPNLSLLQIYLGLSPARRLVLIQSLRSVVQQGFKTILSYLIPQGASWLLSSGFNTQIQIFMVYSIPLFDINPNKPILFICHKDYLYTTGQIMITYNIKGSIPSI